MEEVKKYAPAAAYKQEIRKLLDLIDDAMILCRIYTIVVVHIEHARKKKTQAEGKEV